MAGLHISSIVRPEGAARDEIVALCTAAYGEPFARYLDDIGPAIHLLGRDARGMLVSHVAWVARGLQTQGGPVLQAAYFEAVATLPGHEGQGHASTLLRRAADTAAREEAGFDLAALSPSDPAFYARLGWQEWRGPLFQRRDGRWEATPGEGVMVLPLPRTPPLDLDTPLSVEWRPGEVW